MDWPIASAGWDVQEAWVESVAMVGWGVLIWAGVAAAVAVLLPSITTQAVRRRRFWCARVQREVEAEFEEHGLIGFRRAVGVRSCSVFDSSTHVHCRRSCLDQDVRVRLPMTLSRPWRWP